ncbi:serine hydrolase domain-containing protein [Saccharopolyspora sp. ID03-671]|uniref:serine hydrolase domain-containing protein n=1 Tax=Saccharopolyspora sp. ID03-671 TaxID=3073066 RepID=UPI0032463577
MQIEGYVSPGFEPVADAFAENFTVRGDRGAACAVMIDGELVVDIHGGAATAGKPWNTATRSVVFSVSKGVTTICLLMAAERGLVDLDEPVATYWPEFGARGKDMVTVRELLAHRTGLIAPEHDHTADDVEKWFPVVDGLAAQDPMWTPGTTFAYHPLTFGWLAGEVLRRATGKRPAEWLAQEITGPLGLRTTFGTAPNDPDLAPILPPTTAGYGIPGSVEELGLQERSMGMGGAFSGDPFLAFNTETCLRAEIPAANLVTSARDLATLYSATVSDVDGVRLTGSEIIARAREPISSGAPFFGPDQGNVWATGFMVHSRRRGMAGPGSFGHDGAGGQLAFAHPDLRLGFGYQTVQAGGDDDLRSEILSTALRACL